jgi:hypothetical protein
MRAVASSLTGRLRRGRDKLALESSPSPELVAVDDYATGDAPGTDQPSTEGPMGTPGNWADDGFVFDPPPTEQPPTAPPTRHATHPAGSPEFVVGAAYEPGSGLQSSDLGMSGLQSAANRVGQAIMENAPGESGILFSDLSRDAFDDIMTELRYRGVISGQPVVLKRNGSLLQMRTTLGQKVELWLYPIEQYADTAVVLRRDNRLAEEGGEYEWSSVLLAVVKTKTANLPAFGRTSKGAPEPSTALLEVLRESYLVTASVAEPRHARDLPPALGGPASLPRPPPEWLLADSEPGGDYGEEEEPDMPPYIPLNERDSHGHAHGPNRGTAWFSNLMPPSNPD